LSLLKIALASPTSLETVIIIKENIKAEDALFPEKVARTNEILSNKPNLPDGL
jgi:hypothetical protein